MTNYGKLYQLDISSFYFYKPFAVPDFCLLEIYKKLGLPLSAITFTVNSHADNHFYKYIYLFQIWCNRKSVFILKYMLRFVIFKFYLDAKKRFDFFNKNHCLQKNSLHEKKKIFCRLCENY